MDASIVNLTLSTAYLNTQDGSAYSGTLSLDSTSNNLIVRTTAPFNSQSKVAIEVYIDSTSACNFIQSVKIILDIEICGSELVNVYEPSTPFYFNSTVIKDPNYVLTRP